MLEVGAKPDSSKMHKTFMLQTLLADSKKSQFTPCTAVSQIMKTIKQKLKHRI